ncbi:surface lipoprotein assembly modifier [Gayadomonas joobiniege]|uniref:surface lipoprotein assembly modifier n=1 Tax=Gayadomonas joobiniege TaxID=1234606 RepID=UPI00037B9BA4|nr:surface lipoprotein assembly modifier [Gayadomonas joobiniege]
MNPYNYSKISLSALALTITCPVLAEFSSEFNSQVGVIHDSQLTIAELDGTSENQSDTARQLKASAKLNWQNEQQTVQASYSFNQKDYQSANDYDTQYHLIGATYSHKLAGVKLAARYNFADIKLAGDDFLDLNMLTLDAGYLFNEHFYLRLAHTFRDKTFAEPYDNRDASANISAVDSYYFFNNKQFINLNLSYETEEADDPFFNFDQQQLKATFSQAYQLFKQPGKAQLVFQYQQKDYQNWLIADSQQHRDDNSQSIKLILEQSVSQWLSLNTGFEYADKSSNLAAADYSERLLDMSLTVSF